MTVASTFQSYLSSLELTDRERADASAQQVALRDHAAAIAWWRSLLGDAFR